MPPEAILTAALIVNGLGWLAMLRLLPTWQKRWEAVGWLQRDEQAKREEAARRDRRTGQFVSPKPIQQQ